MPLHEWCSHQSRFRCCGTCRHQIKNAIDATIELGGSNYVFWGGREGYMSLLNTDQKREKEHLAQMLTIARDYARARGFKGTFLIEPETDGTYKTPV